MEELIQRSLNGDQDAYTELVKSIGLEMYRIAISQLGNVDDANDAIQETMIHSYYKLHTLKNHCYFKTWIIRILINECHNIHRKKKRQFDLFNKISNSIDVATYAENRIQNKEDDIDFDLLINKLNYNDRLILTLYYKNRYTPTEISYILNTSVNTVKSRFLRAKQKLKQLYNKGGLNNENKK